jgi:MoaA/NifB/PqqE/SkfB family radical SAM enzyme
VAGAGRLTLPPDVAALYGLDGNTETLVEATENGLRIRRPVTHLARVYIEPTNTCNLLCRTCVRNQWDEKLGRMSARTFEHIMASLAVVPLPLTVFFGGFGEPLSHPHIADMVRRAKGLGATVEMISNGTLLTEEAARRLIDAGLDVLWVSLDGATPESYTDVRLGAALPSVLDNLERFRALRPEPNKKPELGIAFVAMKRNIGDLPALLRLGRRLGVSRYSVSGVLPHTPEMTHDALYERSLGDAVTTGSVWAPHISLPRLDMDDATREAFLGVLRSGRNITLGGASLNEGKNRCPFIEKGAVAIGWNGEVSPCLPLLHDHTTMLSKRQRLARHHSVGNINRTPLAEMWLAPEYLDFRRRVQLFDFAPCTLCGGCDLAEANSEDCLGNPFPTCGGCLWAQGVIQCP